MKTPIVLRSLPRVLLRIALGAASMAGAAAAAPPASVVVEAPGGATLRSFDANGHEIAVSPDAESKQGKVARVLRARSRDGVWERTTRIPGTDRRVATDGSLRGPDDSLASPTAVALAPRAVPGAGPSIDSMTTQASAYGYDTSLLLIGWADVYTMSDGSSWSSGAGSARFGAATLDHVETDGTTIRYVLQPPGDGILYEQTDFDGGDHSAQGTFGVAGPLVLEATIGSATAVMRGELALRSNDPTWYGEPLFHFYTAVVGSVLPFEATYQLTSGTWTEQSFDSTLSYWLTGWVDFANPTSVPALIGIDIVGSGQVLANGAAQFAAVASFDHGASKNVTAVAEWSVEPASETSVTAGLLITSSSALPLTLRVSYEQDGVRVTAEKSVKVVAPGAGDLADGWDTYQAGRRHAGSVAIALDPERFALRWQRVVGSGLPLNPVTAAEGKVFVSLESYFSGGDTLFALDARDGATLWSKGFGDVFSVNPPAYGYGNVYVQTGNHGSDTWLRAYDAETGASVFQAPHEAQWESYYAPTLFDGSVYVNGGTYGGMYAFDAFSGERRWFHGLQQYDHWTPAVDETRAYAYIGSYQPALYVLDRFSGNEEFRIDDPSFEWNGWSMNLAPVLGDQGEVLAIHDGRLIRFDLAGRRIAWQIEGGFQGQPTLAKGAIYTISAAGLDVRHEQTGARLWTWTPPAGETIQDTMIATDTHLLLSTATRVHAIELLSHAAEWSFEASGKLALANETLYVAGSDGTLTAIALPEFSPAPPVALDISGPAVVQEFTTASFHATVTYGDGRVRDRTGAGIWSISPTEFASIDADGVLSVGELLVPAEAVEIQVTYIEGDTTLTTSFAVDLAIGLPLDAFVERNLLAAQSLQQQAITLLEQASIRERAAARVIGPLRHLRETIAWTQRAREAAQRSIEEIRAALEAPFRRTRGERDPDDDRPREPGRRR
jgi:hypothetical protein